MRFLKVAGVVLGALAVRVSAENSDCNAMSTVFVTVSAVTVTETVKSAAPSMFPIQAVAESAMPTASPLDTTGVTATATIYLTYTNIVSVFQATSSSSVADQDKGPYYFSVSDGTTIWLDGKTPAAVDSFVTLTTSIVVAPTPSSSDSSDMNEKHSTSTSTVFMTKVVSEFSTETLTKPSTVPTSAKSFAGIGAFGWNGTTTSAQKAVSGASGIGSAGPMSYATNIGYSYSSVPQFATSYTKAAQIVSTNATKIREARQIEMYVTATINGVVVSWINNWHGDSPATPTPSDTSSTMLTVEMVSSASLAMAPSFYGSSLPPTFTTVPSSAFSTMYSSSSSLTEGAVPFGPPTVHHSGQPTTIVESLVSVTTASAASTTAPTMITTQAPTPSQCGETGDFTITFNDLPTFAAAPNETHYPPLFNPYHKLFWAQGFAYLPPPSSPFLPFSPPQLAIFVVNSSANVHSNTGPPIAGDELNGEFGAGPRAADSAYWIDAYSAYLGCQNMGPADCVLTINGYTYSDTTQAQLLTSQQVATLPPCPGLVDCALAEITFIDDFRNLSGLQIIATVGEEPVTWFMDNLELAWSNNSCEAISLRDSSE